MRRTKTGRILSPSAIMWAILSAPLTGHAVSENEQEKTSVLPTVTVSGGENELIGIANSATEGVVTAQQLRNRPLLRPAEVMETVPGMAVTQHSGDGKANQYFLRGFNLDHGSDFATTVMGMPVNMVSHAHGQGYMDLNFLIPELIGSMGYRKGPYAAEDGDFATTGSARIDYLHDTAEPFLDLGIGPDNYKRALMAGSKAIGDASGPRLLGGLELVTNNGPWDQPEHLLKTNGVLRLSSGTIRNGYALTAMAYQARWVATEHVPERAITSGEIGRYGMLVPGDGGRTHRFSLSGQWTQTEKEGKSQGSAYFIDYGLNLFSNPSGYTRGPQGDQHEQADRRQIIGGDASHTWIFGAAEQETALTLGAQIRHDRIGTLGLYDTVDRQRTDTVREDRVRQTEIGLYGEASQQWSAWLRTHAGLRLNDVSAKVTPTGGVFNEANGDQVHAHMISPKLGMAIGPFELPMPTEFYANWGQGFHSNDARGASSTVDPRSGDAIQTVPLLVRATSSELGLRATPLPGWRSSLALWRMDLASELVFIGDEGVTEPKGASHRVGIEWCNDWQINRWLLMDGDVAWSRARFNEPVNGGDQVPNAIPLIASVALTADDHGIWFGGLRWRYIGSYALEESGARKSAAQWTANLKLGYRVSRQWQFTLDVLNVFDRKANDIEYWGAACSRADGPGCNGGDGIDGRLIHPMEPRTFRLAMRASF